MNPNKKKEIVERVVFKYQLYKSAMLEYIKKQNTEKETVTLSGTMSESSEDYYNTASETPMIKPNIYYFMDANERKVLKKIMERKAGYENVNLNKLPNKYKGKNNGTEVN